MKSRLFPLVAGMAMAGALALSACGSDGSGSADASGTPSAQAGYQLFHSKGCAACHGNDAEGGVGPGFEGLYGSQVQLSDGTAVTADDAYLEQAIIDPNSQKVDGFNVPMPTSNLSDTEVQSLIAYIASLK